jgi:hypothetical protein
VKGCVGAVLVAVLVLIAAAPAAAAVHTGGGADTSGDGTGGAARDVTNVTASYDDATGAIAFQVTFAAAPTAGDTSLVAAAVGTKQSNRGIPKGGLPTCTSVTAGVDAKGEPTDGCLRYTPASSPSAATTTTRWPSPRRQRGSTSRSSTAASAASAG